MTSGKKQNYFSRFYKVDQISVRICSFQARHCRRRWKKQNASVSCRDIMLNPFICSVPVSASNVSNRVHTQPKEENIRMSPCIKYAHTHTTRLLIGRCRSTARWNVQSKDTFDLALALLRAKNVEKDRKNANRLALAANGQSCVLLGERWPCISI